MTIGKTAPTPNPMRLTDSPGLWRVAVIYSIKRTHRELSLALTSAPLHIGRDQDADLALDDDQVSRNHAVISQGEDIPSPMITDLDSFNGTFVNGQRITSAELGHGDIVRVGSHVLMIQLMSMNEVERIGTEREERPTSIVGRSLQTQALLDQVAEAAPLDIPALILGESGTGKELVAEELHRWSQRRGSFVAVNCAALPDHLVESELFGHAYGAFTGADRQSEGIFGEANGGTLFLDEIGEMPLQAQAKLLRALATGEVRGVGQTQAREVDVRIVAATNVDLESAIDAETFRHDLFARLMGIMIHITPLRDRRGDIIALAEHFLARDEGIESGVPITPDAAEALLIHSWRFNVRELEQVVRVAAVVGKKAGYLALEHLPRKLRAPFNSRASASAAPSIPAMELPLPLHVARDAVPTGGELRLVLKHFDGNISRVASFFRKDRRQIYRWARRLGIDVDRFRVEGK